MEPHIHTSFSQTSGPITTDMDQVEPKESAQDQIQIKGNISADLWLKNVIRRA